MKKFVIALVAVVVAALIAAGSFWAGVTYQTSRVDQIRADFMNSRGQGNRNSGPGQMPGGNQGPGGGPAPFGTPGMNAQGGGFGRGGTNGQIKSIQGNVLQLSTAQNVTTVTLTDATRILKYTRSSATELQPGLRVTIVGQRDSQGNLTASQITVLEADSFAPGQPIGTPPAP